MARAFVSALLTGLLGLTGVWATALPASAAPALSITPITWNVIGLDSNEVNSGPATFASGARVCNTGDTTATNVTSTYVWDTANAYISSTGLTTLSVASLAAAACTDLYFNIAVQRTTSAFDTTRGFHITATADGLGTVSTPTPREIYVEHLISQNRNSVNSLSGPTNVVVGNTYSYVLSADTATNGYEQLSSFLNFPNFAFQILSVNSTYTAPVGGTNTTIYADACGFQPNPSSANYRECVGPQNYSDGKAGGAVVTTYSVKILSAGAFTMNSLIYDLSGDSYHYNSDYSGPGATINVTAVEQVDLSLTKTDSVDPVTAGTDLTYTLTATNAGPSVARNVQITDAVPAGTSFVSASGGGTLAAGTVTWSIGDLASGANVTRTLTVHVNADRTLPLSNTGSVTTTTTDTNGADNSAAQGTAVATSAGLSLTKTDSDDPTSVGTNLTYTLTVSNAGPSDATAVALTDPLPAGVAYVSATPSQGTCFQAAGIVSCSLDTVASGSNATVSVVVAPTADGSLTNTASVSSATSDPDGGNNGASESTAVTPIADLRLSKDDGVAVVVAGTSTTYTLTLTNTGPSPVPAGVVIGDAIPADVDASESEADCDLVAGTLTCTTTSAIAVGSSVAYQVDVVVDADYAGATLSNTATIASSPYADVDGSDDSATDVDVVTTEADLGVTVDDEADPVALGDDVTYTITIANLGPSDAQSVVATAPLPVGLAFASADAGCLFVPGMVTCSVPTLAAGASAAFDVVTTPSVAGTVSVPVGVASATGDANGANDGDLEDTTVTDSADLSLTKTDDVDPVGVGSNLTYTLSVHNAGPSDAQSVDVTDVLPGTVTFVSATPSQGTCSEAAGTVSCALGTVLSGADAAVDVVVTPTVGGAVSNMASVSSATADPDASNDDASEDTSVLAVVAADLSLVKDDGSATVVAGGWSTYTLTLHNAGPDDAPAGVVLSDVLPSGTTGTESEADCDLASGTLTCTTSSALAAGASVLYEVDVTLPPDFADPTLSNTAQVDSSPVGDPDGSNDSSTDVDDVVARADLSIGLSDTPDPVLLGDDVTYTMVVSNAGPSDAASVSGSSVLPAGATFVSADPACALALGTVICSAGTLSPGASASFDVVLHPTATGVLTFDAFVTSTTTDTDPLNDTDSEPTDVVAIAPTDVDLAVDLADTPDPVGEGQTLSYNLGVQNAGPADAAGVEISEQLPAGVTFVSASAGCTEAAGVVTCTVGALNNGASANRSVIVTAPSFVTPLSASALVTTTSVDTDPSDDTMVEPTGMLAAPPAPGSADLAVTVTDAPDPVNAGDTVTYAIQVSNAGPDDATNSVLTFTLPPGTAFTSATPLQGTCSQAGGVVTCPLGTIAAGGSTSISVVVTLTLVGSATASALVVTNVTDPVAANDSATAITTVNGVADLSLAKGDGATSVVPGTSTTYTVTLSNAGPSSAVAGVVVVDHLPAGTTAHVTDPACVISGADVSCTTTGPLASGASISWQVTVDVPVAFAGATVDNSAAITFSPTADPNNANDTASDQDAVTPGGVDLSLTKDADLDVVSIGDVVAYTIVVANAGPADATGVEVEDELPEGLEFVSAHADRGAYDEATAIWSVGDLLAGDDATLVLKVRVTDGASSSITNQASVLGLDQTDPTPANEEASADVQVLAEQIEVLGPSDGLAFTGFDVELAAEITLGLLLLGAMLVVLGRRLERRTRPTT